MVAWENSDDQNDLDIKARSFDTGGEPVDGEFTVNTTDAGWQTAPAVGAFSADNPVGNELLVNANTENDQTSSALAYIPNGPSRYILVWQSKNEDGDNWGIYAQRLTPTCTKQADPFKVNTATVNVQSEPTIAVASDGSFLVAWRSLNQDGDSYGVYAQRYYGAGNAVGDEFKLNRVTAAEQSSPTVAFLSDNTLLAGWKTLSEDEAGYAVKFQHYNSDFSVDGLDFLGNIYYPSNQDSPFALALDDGNYVLLWRSDGQDGDAGGIIGRVLP